MKPPVCDVQTGVCSPAAAPHAPVLPWQPQGEPELIYVGDPMCSWCWGMAPALQAFAAHALQQELAFSVVLGGLRPGGADAWTA